MQSAKPTAIVYIDGLNLYRRLLKENRHYRWLNLVALAELLLPNHEILLVRYFTARVKASGTESEQAVRQEIYFRALRTTEPKLKFHFGRMVTSQRLYPIHPRTIDEDGYSKRVKVIKTEEKGSDVALGSFMVLDAAKGLADLYVLISSDSDLAPPLNILRDEFNAQIAVFSPNSRFTRALSETGPNLMRNIRERALERAQFPEQMSDVGGIFWKPDTWG